jgi:hypothetical protein
MSSSNSDINPPVCILFTYLVRTDLLLIYFTWICSNRQGSSCLVIVSLLHVLYSTVLHQNERSISNDSEQESVLACALDRVLIYLCIQSSVFFKRGRAENKAWFVFQLRSWSEGSVIDWLKINNVESAAPWWPGWEQCIMLQLEQSSATALSFFFFFFFFFESLLLIPVLLY